ncbi:integrase catalytic domain-containing protein [Nephila pilipes]|uniref:Integrase catalytic domain-containing protein n=1 Tax=Nephila pilipes TaxID=299642 RepID=A0A8X6QLS8_NEPPI|nr:integrase catalytic domain-containing protein [Nephila pilipes]
MIITFCVLGADLKKVNFLQMKFTRYLPNQSKFTELLMFRVLNEVCHGGVSATLAKIRSRYWIPIGRQIVKRVLKDCLICRKYYLKPAQQITAQLPKNRVFENPPFTVTGIDFTGPDILRSGKDSQQKSYIALFICAVTRALHIELTDMKMKSFISCLKRFFARRGSCEVVISDNAKSFKTTDNILKEFPKIIVYLNLKKFVAILEITWQFIAPHTPWCVASTNGS